MAMKVTSEDVNTAFGKEIQYSLAMPDHTLAMMATKILPIRDAWIVDSRCAQHVYNQQCLEVCSEN